MEVFIRGQTPVLVLHLRGVNRGAGLATALNAGERYTIEGSWVDVAALPSRHNKGLMRTGHTGIPDITPTFLPYGSTGTKRIPTGNTGKRHTGSSSNYIITSTGTRGVNQTSQTTDT